MYYARILANSLIYEQYCGNCLATIVKKEERSTDRSSLYVCQWPISGLMSCDVDVAPVVGRRQTLRVEDHAFDVGLENKRRRDLFHRQPGDIVDQLLLGLIVLGQARRLVRVDVGLLQQSLCGLLLGGIRGVVLAVVHVVVGNALIELQGGPVLRVGIVGDPGDAPELQAMRVVGGSGDIVEQFVEVDGGRLDADAQHGLPRLYQRRHFVVQLGRAAWIGQGDGRDLRNAAPAFLLHALLKQLFGQRRVAARTLGAIRPLEAGEVAGHALWHDVVGRNVDLPDRLVDRRLVDGQLKGLANVDVVERLGQVVHGVVVDPQLRHQVELAVRQILRRIQIGSRHSRYIDLTDLVGAIGGVRLLVEGEAHLLQLGVWPVVVGVGNEVDLLVVGIAGDLEGAVAAALGQMIGEAFVAVLVDQALFHCVSARVGQRIQEVGRYLASDDLNSVGVRSQNAIADDRLDLAGNELIGVFDQRQVNGADGRLFRRLQGAVNAVGHVGGGQRGAVAELEIGPQVERPR